MQSIKQISKLKLAAYVAIGALVASAIGLPTYITGCKQMPDGCFATIRNPGKLLPTIDWYNNQCCEWCSDNQTVAVDLFDSAPTASCCAGTPQNCWTGYVAIPGSLGVKCGFRGTAQLDVFHSTQSSCSLTQNGTPTAFRLWITGVVFLFLAAYLFLLTGFLLLLHKCA
jgi:hypothetical protein